MQVDLEEVDVYRVSCVVCGGWSHLVWDKTHQQFCTYCDHCKLIEPLSSIKQPALEGKVN